MTAKQVAKAIQRLCIERLEACKGNHPVPSVEEIQAIVERLEATKLIFSNGRGKLRFGVDKTS